MPSCRLQVDVGCGLPRRPEGIWSVTPQGVAAAALQGVAARCCSGAAACRGAPSKVAFDFWIMGILFKLNN